MTFTQSTLPGVRCRELHETRRRILRRLYHKFKNGFWYCNDCESTTEREEGEQGQPAHCEKCGSHRIEWNQPALQVEQSL